MEKMFYQAWPSQLCYNPSTLPFWHSSTAYLLQNLSLALEKSVSAYASTLIHSFPPSQQTYKATVTTIVSTKAVRCPSSPVKTDSTQKNSTKAIVPAEQPVRQESKQKTLFPTQQSNKILESEKEPKSRDTANIPQFNPYQISQQHKIASLLQRQVDTWTIERPRRLPNRQFYNLS